jgi:ferredoxin
MLTASSGQTHQQTSHPSQFRLTWGGFRVKSMLSMDFTRNPPHVKRNSEGCDVCWCVCPEDAVSIPNIEGTHALLKPTGPEDGFFAALNAAEKSGRFRRLVSMEEIGWDNIVMDNPNAPRVVLKPENYPHEINGNK